MMSASSSRGSLFRLASILTCGALSVSAAPAATGLQQPASLICQLVLEEERLERDDLDLNVRLTLSQMQAAERIHALLDDLWQKKAVERLLYLRGKHNREVTAIDHERARFMLERQDAALEQYRLVCEAFLGRETAGDKTRVAVDDALRKYRRANCDVLASDERRAGADLSYFEEVLLSVRDLRASDVGTEQDVILAERDVEMARTTQEQTRTRVARCRSEASSPP
jgi:hypothetical protein